MKQHISEQSRWRRYVDNLYTCTDLDTLIKKLKEEEDTTDFDATSQKLWEEAEELSQPTLQEYIKNQQLAISLLEAWEQKKQNKRILYFKKWGSIAAMFIVSLSLTIALISRSFKQNYTIAMHEIYAPYGSKKAFTLPDGTHVTLNAGSYLKYPQTFTKDSRVVEFRGEGFFHVTKNKKWPFIIKSGGYKVSVLGTTFNVNNYNENESMALTLCTGKVLVNFDNEQICLKPGEQLLVNKKDHQMERCKVDIDNYSLWMKGKLYFDKTPIQEVVRMLERCYDCSIKLKGNGPFINRLSGTHDNKDLQSVLRSIEMICGYKYKQENGIYVLYK